MSVRLPRLQGANPIVDKDGRPSLTFARYFQSFAEQIERVINAIATILGITEQLDAAIQAANRAAADAQDAADLAKDQADAAKAQADATKREAALTGSYIEPDSVLTATPTLLTIAAHTRKYADGTTAAVNGGTAIATAPGEINYVSYDDPDRMGGAVTYLVTSDPPAQTGDTHVVGAVQIPETGTVEGGNGPQRPGQVYPNKFGTEPEL